MFNVIGQSSYDKFERIILGGVSKPDAEEFIKRHKGVYVDHTGFMWYLRVQGVFPEKVKNQG